MEDKDKEYIFRWGLSLQDLYSVALKFFKEKEGSAIQFSYEEKCKLIAFTRQVAHGKYNEDKLPPLGVLDVIGRDRRLAWQALGDMSPRDAMAGFIQLIDKRCLHFNAFVQAQKATMEEQKRLSDEKKKKEIEEIKLKEEERAGKEKIKHQEEITRRQIQDALNQQTYHQFKSYAEQQFPGNPEQQAVLIRQLQDQHYHQYMLQLQQQQKQQQKEAFSDSEEKEKNSPEIILEGEGANTIMNPESVSRIISDGNSDTEDSESGVTLVHPASMWTRKDIQEFKNQVRKEGADTIMKVGHGETVTVRVPTHEGGSCLFWEFATDSYDIGFGIYFEWEKPLTKEVSVHISETEDEDSDDLMDDEQELNDGDLERARASQRSRSSNKPPTSVIVPIYRRDCHEEVYAGSHPYPGEGVYLLKFDNSYSLWRSKTLYYRIYYTR
ncbi:Golgi resident protein GCP60 [Planococcus citri]|uniref:Golgi resident protein GCP60 n=1 Tax=Planococcus citri TaxID=170843 RepID=UPI0031F732EB